MGDILELESGVLNYVNEHKLEENELDLLEKLKDAFHNKQLISLFWRKRKKS